MTWNHHPSLPPPRFHFFHPQFLWVFAKALAEHLSSRLQGIRGET